MIFTSLITSDVGQVSHVCFVWFSLISLIADELGETALKRGCLWVTCWDMTIFTFILMFIWKVNKFGGTVFNFLLNYIVNNNCILTQDEEKSIFHFKMKCFWCGISSFKYEIPYDYYMCLIKMYICWKLYLISHSLWLKVPSKCHLYYIVCSGKKPFIWNLVNWSLFTRLWS